MNKEVKFFKFDEDDILEILTEYIAENEGIGRFNARAMLIGTPMKDLRMICAMVEDDDGDSMEPINSIDLVKLDIEMDFNGCHKNAKYLSKAEFLKIDTNNVF